VKEDLRSLVYEDQTETNHRKTRIRRKQGCRAATRVHVEMESPFCGGDDGTHDGVGCTHERVRLLVKGVKGSSLQTVVNGAAKVGDELRLLNPSDGSIYRPLKL
jgi:hypothetical protein